MAVDSFFIKAIPFRAAQVFIETFHRHSLKPQGHKFSLALVSGFRVIGVACTGRPVNYNLDNGSTLEITRLCTDGTFNACSMLYGATRRAAEKLGYDKLITYTLSSESGASLKASNFSPTSFIKAAKWSRIGRPRRDFHVIADRIKWEILLNHQKI